MARSDFGGTGSDIVLTVGLDRALRLASATLTFWSAQTGGTQYTDLLLNGLAVSQIVVGTDGQIPTFSGPDTITTMWADAGGTRVRMVAPGTGGTITGDVIAGVLVWRYTGGSYPTLPLTLPAGVKRVDAVGPAQPSTVPSWVGLGVSQVPAFYTYAPVT